MQDGGKAGESVIAPERGRYYSDRQLRHVIDFTAARWVAIGFVVGVFVAVVVLSVPS